MRLFSYKLTHDTGFAPNPFWGVLTLATCKPQFRLKKKEGDWIAGFTSRELCGHPVGMERLVYLMQVHRKLRIADYFHDPEFASKIPNQKSQRGIDRAGDNIYRPKRAHARAPSDFFQLPNDHHHDKADRCSVGDSQRHDLSGEYVLTAQQFVYFGSSALKIPSNVRPEVPAGQSSHGKLTRDELRSQRFIDYVFSEAKGQRVRGSPHFWKSRDESWRE
jgi:hypothetical protein